MDKKLELGVNNIEFWGNNALIYSRETDKKRKQDSLPKIMQSYSAGRNSFEKSDVASGGGSERLGVRNSAFYKRGEMPAVTRKRHQHKKIYSFERCLRTSCTCNFRRESGSIPSSPSYQSSNSSFEKHKIFPLKMALEFREKAAKLIPSLAKIIFEEQEMGWQWKCGCIILQAQIIDHLWDYIEKTIQPTKKKIKELWHNFDYEMRRMQQQLEKSHHENCILESKVEKLTEVNAEAEEKLEYLSLSNEQLEGILKQKHHSDVENSMVLWLEKQLEFTQSRLSSVVEEVKTKAREEKEMQQVMRTYGQRLNEVSYERDFAVSEVKVLEQKLDEVQRMLGEKPWQRDIELTQQLKKKEEVWGFIEIPFEGVKIDDRLSGDFFEKTTDLGMAIYSLNQELEILEHEHSDDEWLDKSVTSESAVSEIVHKEATQPDTDTEGRRWSTEVKASNRDILTSERRNGMSEIKISNRDISLDEEPEVYFIENRGNLGWMPALTIARNGFINIQESYEESYQIGATFRTTELSLSPKIEPRVISSSMQGSPALNSSLSTKNIRKLKKKKKKVGTAYLQRPARKNDVVAMGSTGFKAAFCIFKKLEEINPGTVNPGKQVYTYRTGCTSKARITAGETSPVKTEKTTRKSGSKVVAKVRVKKQKQRFLAPAYKGYLQIQKSSQNDTGWKYRYKHLFFVCVDALPITTNTRAADPLHTKYKREDKLCPCLFWFENKDKYIELCFRTRDKDVRSKDFQVVFSELALGIVVFPRESTVSTSEQRAVKRLSKMIQQNVVLPQEFPEFQRKSSLDNTDFFIVNKLSDESFDSHKFRAQSQKQRDKWMHVIRSQLKKRLLSHGAEIPEYRTSSYRDRDSRLSFNTASSTSRHDRLQDDHSDLEVEIDQRYCKKLNVPTRVISEPHSNTTQFNAFTVQGRYLSVPHSKIKPNPDDSVEEIIVDFRTECESLC